MNRLRSKLDQDGREQADTASGPTILMNDFRRLWFDTREEILTAVDEVGQSGWFILGARVEEFEYSLARFVGRRFAVGCANGLDAIEISLRALGLEPGDRVLTTPLSAFATTLGILRAGGSPAFVDTDESGLLDLDLVETALRDDPSIKFLVPVHLFGHAIDLSKLLHLKRQFDLRVVEDCCQAIGARSGDSPVGSVGDVSALSFYPTKNLAALGDGGAVFTDDSALCKRARALRDYGQTSKYLHEELGLNSRLDEVHGAIMARAFLPKLAAWTARRAAVAARYRSEITNPQIGLVAIPPTSVSAWHLFPVRVSPVYRHNFQQHLMKHGIASGIHYPKLITDQSALRKTDFRTMSELHHARSLSEQEVSLPIHPYLTEEEVSKVTHVVNQWTGALA